MKFHVIWIEIENPHEFALPHMFYTIYIESDGTNDEIETEALEKFIAPLDDWTISTMRIKSLKIAMSYESEEAYNDKVKLAAMGPKQPRTKYQLPEPTYEEWLLEEYGR